MKCAWCQKPIEGEEPIEQTGIVLRPNRKGGLGTLAERPVRNYWHAHCLELFEEFEAKARDLVHTLIETHKQARESDLEVLNPVEVALEEMLEVEARNGNAAAAEYLEQLAQERQG